MKERFHQKNQKESRKGLRQCFGFGLMKFFFVDIFFRMFFMVGSLWLIEGLWMNLFISSCKCSSRLLLPTFIRFYMPKRFDVHFVAVIMRNPKAHLVGVIVMGSWEKGSLCLRLFSLSMPHLVMHKFLLINLWITTFHEGVREWESSINRTVAHNFSLRLIFFHDF